MDTLAQYDSIVEKCRSIFTAKNRDYGTSWRILRPSSIYDQIFIKAKRIRTIEEKGNTAVDEGVESEFMGIVNYCAIALIQLQMGNDYEKELPIDELTKLYNNTLNETRSLMQAKNSDYGEAWRDMRVSTFTDMMLVRLLRISQINDNDGKTQASEGVESNLMDMINYAIFALIKLDEESK
ncbi:MAG: DUF1599 domain-containing protein [Bacteroidota bacterium]|nr:DUF1599 domain-containing protein [Bacteroidota bacterium]